MSESTTPPVEEVRRRLAIFFNQNQAMVDRYLQLHGVAINMKAIQEVRDEVNSLPKPAEAEENQSHLESPVYSVDLECPCCRQKLSYIAN
jgi:hypothetical protein